MDDEQTIVPQRLHDLKCIRCRDDKKVSRQRLKSLVLSVIQNTTNCVESACHLAGCGCAKSVIAPTIPALQA